MIVYRELLEPPKFAVLVEDDGWMAEERRYVAAESAGISKRGLKLPVFLHVSFRDVAFG